MKRPIAISLSPNVFPKDVFLAIKTLFAPWKYNQAGSITQLETWFKTTFSAHFAFSYTSGRAALYEILRGYDIGEGDEVLTQAFTCVALPNAILATGAKPIYVDIAENLTMDPIDLENKITSKTKAIIMQHTFGIPSHIEKIIALAQKHKIPVIEDCAHGIGVKVKNKLLGEFGNVAFFSFGRDKAFSSVFGGMTITNDEKLAQNLKKTYQKTSFPSIVWTAQQLFHPIAFFFILPLYDFYSLGKMMVVFFQKLHMLSFPVTTTEKKGIYNTLEVKRLPGALAVLATAQLERISEFNNKRKEIAEIYIRELSGMKKDFPSMESLPYLRFPMLSEKRDEILFEMRKQHIYLGKWYANSIDPVGTDFEKIGYTIGMCPKAEYTAARILNLPTFPTLSHDEIAKIVKYIKMYA